MTQLNIIPHLTMDHERSHATDVKEKDILHQSAPTLQRSTGSRSIALVAPKRRELNHMASLMA